MILHILIDDKFSDYVIQQFSSVDMFSDFAIVEESPTFKYFHYPERVIHIFPNNEDSINELIKKSQCYNAIIFHGLFGRWVDSMMTAIPNNIKIAWVFWGAEIYGRKDVYKTFLLPRTKFVYNIHKIKKRISHPFCNKDISDELSLSSLKRISYCMSDMTEEFDYAKKYIGNNFLNHLWYNYYSIEDTIGKLKNDVCSGPNILVGNSCTTECNYFDVLPIIKKIEREGHQIITPFGYGSSWLKKMLLKYGEILFGDNYKPITDFMPRDEYNKILISCSVMIQPQLRCQAQGNIITGLWLGMKVFLYKNTITYNFFKRIGIIFFTIDDDLKQQSDNLFTPLSQTEREHNRKVLMQWYGKDNMHTRILDIVKTLDS